MGEVNNRRAGERGSMLHKGLALIALLLFSIALILTVVMLSARPTYDCETWRGRHMYVETGSLSKCVSREGMLEYTNVRRLDGTFSSQPGELPLLVKDYMRFKGKYDALDMPAAALSEERAAMLALTEEDWAQFARLKTRILKYDKNDISFAYGYYNQ